MPFPYNIFWVGRRHCRILRILRLLPIILNPRYLWQKIRICTVDERRLTPILKSVFTR